MAIVEEIRELKSEIHPIMSPEHVESLRKKIDDIANRVEQDYNHPEGFW